ncbi:MAG: hypothetical protein QOD80_251, partial [Verrucomicrobiota bacterium]
TRRDESRGPVADAVKPGADRRRRGQLLSLRCLERAIDAAVLARGRRTNWFRVIVLCRFRGMNRPRVAQLATANRLHRTEVIARPVIRRRGLVLRGALRNVPRFAAHRRRPAAATNHAGSLRWKRRLERRRKSENAEHCGDGTEAHRNQDTDFDNGSAIEVFCFHRAVLQEDRKESGGETWGLSCSEMGTKGRAKLFAKIASKLIMQHYENIMAKVASWTGRPERVTAITRELAQSSRSPVDVPAHKEKSRAARPRGNSAASASKIPVRTNRRGAP